MGVNLEDERKKFPNENTEDEEEGGNLIVEEKQPVARAIVSFCSCGMYEPVNVYSSPSGYRNSNCKHCGGSPRT